MCCTLNFNKPPECWSQGTISCALFTHLVSSGALEQLIYCVLCGLSFSWFHVSPCFIIINMSRPKYLLFALRIYMMQNGHEVRQ